MADPLARMFIATVFVIAVVAPVDLAAQQPAVPDAASPNAPIPYRLTPGDVVDLKFAYNPELNDTVTLRPDGRISLQRIGDVLAQRLTPLELAARVNEQYAKVLRHPEASVIVRDIAGQKAYVGGEVVAPGPVDLRGGLTSLQAILKTGGLKPTAKLDNVILMRYTGDERAEVRKLNIQRLLEGRDADPLLSPFDVVFVPRSAIGKVGLFVEQYVNGVIPKALMFPYNLNTSVTVK
jgi:protein involved in polysaccharide export with SLBB domain